MTLNDQLQRLARFERVPYPVISLYLDTQPDQHGRDSFQAFLRKELKTRTATYREAGDRDSLDRDLERISNVLATELSPSANGVAIFACSAAGLFETVQLDAPLGTHWLYVGDQPHLYPLARLASQYPTYAAVLADTHRTRILVITAGAVSADRAITGVKTRSTSQGGWSQARYQRHIENYHLKHIKEVVDVLDRIVTSERIDRIVLSGDPVVLPLIREQLPKRLAEKIVDEIALASDAPEHVAVGRTLEALRAADAETDREKVDAAVGAYRAGGLGVVGSDATLLALTNGQVDELLITASLANLSPLRRTRAAEMAIANDAALVEPAVEETAAGEPATVPMGTVRLSDELITKAEQTGARISFIEDAALLEPCGGVAATLRYRI
jgi:peptide subunit release factor 1 (eRF1)